MPVISAGKGGLGNRTQIFGKKLANSPKIIKIFRAKLAYIYLEDYRNVQHYCVIIINKMSGTSYVLFCLT